MVKNLITITAYPQLEDKTLFHEKFIHYLKYAMIVYKREPAVENVIEFVAKFASSFQSSSKNDKEGEQQQEEEEEDEEEDDHPFLTFIFNFLLEVHMLVVVVDPAQVTQSMTSNIFVCVCLWVVDAPSVSSLWSVYPFTHPYPALCPGFPLSPTRPTATRCVSVCAS